MPARLKFAVGGGGTGGHVVPALSVCEAILQLRSDAEVIYVGSRNSIEERMAKERGYRFLPVRIAKLRRGNLLQNLALPFIAALALIQASYHLIVSGAKFVVGTGGFSAWPICAAAKMFGRTYFLQEQNAFPGLVTRMLAGGARRIYLGYDEARSRLSVPDDKLVFTGNPIPGMVKSEDQLTARSGLGIDADRQTVMVTGGSGGALSINQAIDSIKEDLLKRGFNLIWQTGKHWESDYSIPDELKSRLLISRFFDTARMAAAYQASDLVIARSGAMTLAELAMMGLPAILIPYPYAAENHQEFNARAVEKAGGALVVLDAELSPDVLLERISEALDAEKHKSMSGGMKSLAKDSAALNIAEDILARMRC